MNFKSDSPLKNWIPLRMIPGSPEPLIEWFFVGDKTFTEPFFEDTISAIKRAGNRKSFRSVSTPGMMLEWSHQIDSLTPAALVFHVSRCGSTLLSQMLCLDPANIVLSETPFFDDLLRMPLKNTGWNAGTSITNLLAATRLYGQKRTSNQQQLFLKTDSWHLHFYESLRKAFPGIPFILLYRNPAAVFRSQQKKRGLHAVPGMVEPELFGFSRIETNLDLHAANVLGSYYRQMIDIVKKDPLAFPFNFNKGVINLVHKIYGFNGRQVTAELEEKFQSRGEFHGKEPGSRFVLESDSSHLPVCLQPAFALYDELDLLAGGRLPNCVNFH